MEEKNLYLISRNETIVGPDGFNDSWGYSVKPTIVKIITEILAGELLSDSPQRHKFMCSKAPDKANSYLFVRGYDEVVEPVSRLTGYPVTIVYTTIEEKPYRQRKA